MRLGVPFIAPRQLGAVESIPGRLILPSVAWRTGQSGAPPDTIRCGFPSLFGEDDRWQPWSRWRTGHCPVHTGQSGAPSRPLARPRVSRRSCSRPLARPTVGSPDSPEHPPDCWLGHVSHADRAADRWPGRPLAHRTVRCTPDSPVNYSRTPLIYSREHQVRLSQPGTPDTVRCTTGQSGAPRQRRL
jgi:hypothetical protein